MVKRIGQKLRGAAGASIIMALSIMMVVAALSASMLAIAITAPQVAITQQQEQQAYLAVTSAARLIKHILNDATNSYATGRTFLKVLDDSETNASGQKEVTVRLKPDAYSSLNATVTLTKIDDTTVIAKISDMDNFADYSLTISLSVQTINTNETWPANYRSP